jgi:methionine-rich copper-binding protein CopC
MGSTVVSLTKVLFAVTAGALSAILWAIPAQAHNSMTGSSPKDGQVMDRAPASVTLTFLAKLDPAKTAVTITDPDGTEANAGRLGVKGNKAFAGLRAGAAGQYTVAYEVTSTDGHVVKGKIGFTVRKPAPAAATAPAPVVSLGPTRPPATTPTAGRPSVGGPSAGAPSAGGSAVVAGPPIDRVADESPVWPWLLGAGLLIAAIGAGAYLIRRRSTS